MTASLVKVDEVSKTYDPKVGPVLSRASLSVRPGEIVADSPSEHRSRS